MRRDEPIGPIDTVVTWGSDVAAQMLRRLGIRYASLNPGASFRGLHDSLVNHLGNDDPTLILCVHEDHAVGIAHGYAKVTGTPMACILHSNVGLMHGMMALYNAWCDRVPMMVVGATGPVDSAQRRPWIDWVHTAADQGGMVRDFVKFDNQPASPAALVEAFCRADMVTHALPQAPVYICLDSGLQEQRLEREPQWPDLQRFRPPTASAPSAEGLAEILALFEASRRPLLLFGRGRPDERSWRARVALAERVGACVMTDMRTRAVYPTSHPAHVAPPMANASAGNRDLVAAADLIVAFEWPDLGGLLTGAPGDERTPARVVSIGLDHTLHNGAHMNFCQLAAVDLPVAACPDTAVAALLAMLPSETRPPWSLRLSRPTTVDPDRLTVTLVAASLRDAFGNTDSVSLASVCRGWPTDIWPFDHHLSYFGKDGGGGIGVGPSIAVGVSLALHEQGREVVAVLGDGDFIMGGHVLWTAVQHGLPLLVLVNNNRSYLNDELHQEAVARRRGRPVENRWIGQRLSGFDLAGFARMQGAVGIGPVTEARQLSAALGEAVTALRSGHVCLVDIHIDSDDRRDGRSTGERRP